MKMNIIHIRERKDRFETLQNELLNQKIQDYKIWEGIKDSMPCTGISRAHKQIVLDAKQKQLKNIHIAEDDIKFTSLGAFEYFLTNIPVDFDIYLGGIIYGKIMANNAVNDFSGLTMYILNCRFYDQFLTIPENYHLDRALKDKGKFIVCNPMVVTQHDGYSDNVKRFVTYEAYLHNKLLFKSK